MSFQEYLDSLKCLCIENFEYFFPTEIENLVFLVHDDHIFFALAGEKGIEISVCFEALDANFWWPLLTSYLGSKRGQFLGLQRFASKGQGSISLWCAISHKNGKQRQQIINLR